MCDNPALAASLVDPLAIRIRVFVPTVIFVILIATVLVRLIYRWFCQRLWLFFQSGVKPGACSSDEGMCVPNSEFCGFDQYCESVSCNCATVPEPFVLSMIKLFV
jgi:hypothetical protein